ncbi:MAG: hypothetical protein WDA03_10890 [Trueperaceae bacterium]
MSGLLGLVQELAQRLVRNWPRKLVALLAAVGFWWLVSTTTTTITQRTFFSIPLEVDGVEAEDLAVGVPDFVDVAVSGPGPRIDRLRPDQLRATLDLTGASGDFDRQVVVQTPQEVRLQSVSPSNVIGFLETVAQRSVPVEVAVTGTPQEGTQIRTAATPSQVVLTGRQQQLAAVTRAVAFTGPNGGEAAVIALGADDQPVTGVTVVPAVVDVSVGSREVLYVADLLIRFEPPVAAALTSATLSRPTVRVAGEPAVLMALDDVVGTVEPMTGEVAPGRYTLPVRLALPEGVVALEAPTAVLQYVSEPLQP